MLSFVVGVLEFRKFRLLLLRYIKKSVFSSLQQNCVMR